MVCATCANCVPHGTAAPCGFSSDEEESMRGMLAMQEKKKAYPCHQLFELSDGKSQISSVAFSACGRFILGGGKDGSLLRWCTDTGNLLACAFKHTKVVTRVAASPDGRYVYTASLDGTLRRWDSSGLSKTEVFPGHPGHVEPQRWFALKPCGSMIVSCAKPNMIFIHSTDTLRIQGQCTLPHPVADGAVHPDGKVFAALDARKGSKNVTFVCLETMECLSTVELDKGAGCVVYSPRATRLICGHDSGWVTWNSQKGRLMYPLTHGPRHGLAVSRVVLSACQAYAYSSSHDGTVRVWELGEPSCDGSVQAGVPKEVEVLTASKHSAVLSIAASPCGRYFVCSTCDGHVQLWS
eukprot:Rhum_TRINITY_DN25692_c0_g1::Rhum_TRINITY_DN25692_c0_g1_i1::g.182590::m.182590